MELLSYFRNISDPRVVGRSLHLLHDIIGIAIIAVLAECDEWQDIEDWAKSKKGHLKKYFLLPNGIPSHDTFERIFSLINPIEFERSFSAWAQALLGEKNKFIHIDGKSLRGSQNETQGKKMLHLVGAWASDHQLLLGQIKTEEKSNEISAIPELLKMLDLEDVIVTIDAMGCQKEIAKNITAFKADYILAVKENQRSLHEQIEMAFEKQTITQEDITIEKDHGRIETRKCQVITNLLLLDETDNWMNCKSVIKIIRTREVAGKISNETAYFISSLNKDAAFMNKAVRRHWSIENQLHWSLDVTFNEDKSRKRKKNQAENFSILRRIALNVLKAYKGDKRSIKRRRKMASYEFDYLLALLKI